jgi:DNA polymerase I-like protein with 3'-5' exonuclease and polymerase domains
MAKVKPIFVNTLDDVEKGKKAFLALSKNKFLAFDYETNGLDAYRNSPLLLAIGDSEKQLVINTINVPIELIIDKPINIIAHNSKFDYKFATIHSPKLVINQVWDTMIVEQKLFQNTSKSMSLIKLVDRYLKKIPRAMVKSVRNTFIGKNPKHVKFTDAQIEYAAADVAVLHEIMEKQTELTKHYNLYDWLVNTELPLVKVLAKCELKGFELDVKAFREVIEKNKEIRQATAIELDDEFRKLRDTLLTPEESKYIRGGIYDNVRQVTSKPKLVGLFGELSEYEFYSAQKAKNVKTNKSRTVKIDENTNKINWNSDNQIKDIFAYLKQPIPCVGEAGKKYGYLTPVVRNGRILYSIGLTKEQEEVFVPNYDQKEEGFSVGKKAFNKYFIDNPNSPMRKFVELLQRYSKANHEINSFGENFINYINPHTNRIHTIFRQASSVNGRLQSGGGRKDADKINFQNIPRDAKFRHCFKAGNNHSVITCDLSGAEVTFMCDKANDEKLFNWAVVNDDSHSPMVQNVWRHIFLYRAGFATKVWFNAKAFITMHTKASVIKELEERCAKHTEGAKWLELSRSFIVNKKTNKPYRQAGKNGTFGGVYGMKAAKAAETFNGTDVELAKVSNEFEPVNVTLEEGKIILFAQKRAIPKTYKMVETNVRKGMAQGFIILNNRSNSRIWFEEVIALQKIIYNEFDKNVDIYYVGNGKYDVYVDNMKMTQYEVDWKAVKDYDGQGRNVPISGTQADCLKEAMVDIDNYIIANNLQDSCYLLSQVHDELVYGCDKSMDGVSAEWHNNHKPVIFTFDTEQSLDVYTSLCEKYQGHIIEPVINELGIKQIVCSFSLFVALTMIQCANRFLEHVEMKAEFEVMDSWTK